ncbi:MAG TPA: hypothetical protein DHW02_16235, partial [Ktedonobacter sp.]|nr:hypothetical protein [Ktedonobacter sp.]
AGIGASYLVRTVVEHAFTLHLPIVLDWFTIGSGCVIGLSTALIFGLLPIVQASQIRPLSVLREGGESIKASSWATTIGLLVLLSILFVALATSILGDLITAITAVYGGAIVVLILALGLGLLVLAISKLPVYERPDARMLLWILSASGIVVLSSLAFALLGYIGTMSHTFAVQHNNSTVGIYILAVLGGLGIVLVGASLVFLLATLLDAFVMFLPRAWKTPVMLAYRNMGRQRVRTTTTLTALFVGIFAIGLVLVLGQGIQNTINDTLSTLFTRNVFVVVSPRQSGRIATRIPSLKGVDTSKTEMSTVVPRLYPLFINGQDVNTVLRETPTRGTLDRGDVASGFNSIQGFDVKQGGNSIPAIILSAGRNLTETDAGTNNVLVNARLEGAPLNLR